MKSFFQTASALQTEKIGEALSLALLSMGKRRAVIAMRGEMGVGKTAFARGFARALRIPNVKSPTYTVVNEYRGVPVSLFHFDMYRITSEEDLYSIGFDDYLSRDGYCLIEWSENVQDFLPDGIITVTLSKGENASDRTINIEGLDS